MSLCPTIFKIATWKHTRTTRLSFSLSITIIRYRQQENRTHVKLNRTLCQDENTNILVQLSKQLIRVVTQHCNVLCILLWFESDTRYEFLRYFLQLLPFRLIFYPGQKTVVSNLLPTCPTACWLSRFSKGQLAKEVHRTDNTSRTVISLSTTVQDVV